MGHTWIQLPTDSASTSAGRKTDAESLTVGAFTVARQRMQIGGSTAADIVKVANSNPSGSAYGAVVRPVGAVTSNGDTIVDETNDAYRVTVVTAVQNTKIIPSSALTLTRATISVNTTGDNTIIAASTGQTINVYGMAIHANSTNDLIMKSATGTTLHPIMALAANQDKQFSLRPDSWFTCGSSEAFVFNTSSTNQISGVVDYTKG